MVALKCLFLVFLLSFVDVECTVRRKRIVGGNEANIPVSPSEIEEEDRISEIEENEEDLEDLVKNLTIIKHRRLANFKGILEPEGYHSFYGIRYAEPPVGLYRFQRPEFLQARGDIDATRPGPPCVQPTPNGLGIVGSEDCLFLNVYTPRIPESQNGSPDFPVFMWVHGGGFRRGSASQYNPADLVKKGLVVVTVQYRLGSLGFLSTHRNELPGNTALFDLGAAVEWIQKYIIYFGGDPKNIVPAGQGSGASAATMLSLTGLTKNSIKGLFAMSGSPLSSFAVDNEPKKSAAKVSEIDNCHSENDGLQFVRCMQQLPVENIIKGDNHLQDEKLQDGTPESFITSLSSVLSPAPSVERDNDDRFLPYFLATAPIETMKAGNVSSIPLLTGVTKEETSTSVKGGLATKLLERLEAVPDFLEQSLVPNLLNINTGLFSNGRVNPLLGALFSNNNYLKAVTSTLETAASAADKAIEVTTDAIFNLPAFTTSLYWTKKNKAYMYSFEHEPTKPSSQYFLDGLPLVQTKEPKQKVEGAGHGDDLVYLFDVRSLDGAKIPNTTLTDAKDLRVRDHYTTMVAEFVKTGTPRVGGQEWNSFTPDGEYVKITDEPTIETGFRKCQMGLWAGIPELLKSSECSFLNVHDLVTDTIKSGATGLLGPTGLGGLVQNNLIKTASNLGGGLQDGLPVDVVNPSNLPVRVLTPSNPVVGGFQGILNPLGSGSSSGRRPSPNAQPVPSLVRPLGGGIFG